MTKKLSHLIEQAMASAAESTRQLQSILKKMSDETDLALRRKVFEGTGTLEVFETDEGAEMFFTRSQVDDVTPPQLIAQHASVRVVRSGVVYRYYSVDGGLISHQQSSDHDSISGHIVALQELSTGDFILFDTSNNQFETVGTYDPGGEGHLNINLVWTDTVGEYYILKAGRLLERRQAFGGLVWAVTLPGQVAGPTTGNATPQYRLSAGSNDAEPWIGLYLGDDPQDPGDVGGHTGNYSFNAADGSLVGSVWWYGNLTGGSSQSSRAGNAQSAMGGRVFKPSAADQHLLHWTDGTSKVQIEPGGVGVADEFYHSSFVNFTEVCGDNNTQTGGSGIQEIVVYDHSDPPTLAGRVFRCSLAKQTLLKHFPGEDNPNQLALHHPHAFIDADGSEKAWCTILHAPSGREILILLSLADCSYVVVMTGFFNRPEGIEFFNSSPRPTGNAILGLVHSANLTEERTEVLVVARNSVQVDAESGSTYPVVLPPPLPPPPPESISVPMMDMATVEISGMVASGGVQPVYSVVSVSGDATAELRGSQLVCQSGVEAGPITVQYRATQGAKVTNGSLEITLTDTFTLADVESFVLYDIDNLIALGSSFENNQDNVYEASYTCLGLRNMFQGTGKRLYFDKFKSFIDAAIADATNNYTATSTGNPAVSGVPHEDFGGDTTADAYSSWQDPVTFFPNQKATDQFAMTALLFVLDVIEQNGEATVLNAADRTWAEDVAYAFISKNIIEFNRCKYGDGGVHLGFVAKSARDRVVNNFTSFRWGYWGSNIGVAMCALTIDTAIRESLAIGDHSYIAVQQAYAVSEDWEGEFGHPYSRETDWWEWWKESVDFDNQGRATWDVGNPNLSASNGWAHPGEEKAPDIGHGYSRYNYLAWLKLYLAQDTANADSILNGLDRNWSEVCVLPDDYVTPDGTFAGQVADGIQVSNYINGVDTKFRDYTSAVGSTAGMGSFSYYSQLGFKRAESRQGLARLYRNAIVFQSTGSKERTGTWERHSARNNYGTPETSTKYTGFGLIGNFLAALKQPL